MRFIKLTYARTSIPVYVAVERVTFVSTTTKFLGSGGYTGVHFAGGGYVVVGESVDFVVAALSSDADAKAADELA